MSRWSAAVLLALAACGGQAQEPLLGDGQVRTHTRNRAGCAVEGPAATTPSFVRFQLSDVEGQSVLELVDCTAPGSCAASAGVSGRLYTRKIPGGLRADAFAAFGDSTRCALGARRSDAVLAADGTLRVETRTYEERDLFGVTCDVASAERLLASLTCLELDVITAAQPATAH
jgi:hypothetical protein